MATKALIGRVVSFQSRNDKLYYPAFFVRQIGDFMKEWAESFYKSKAWQSIRDTAIRRDKYLCVDCLRSGKYTPAEEVHHIIPLTPENITDPDISLNLANLASLCRECHQARHGARQRRYKVDEFGRVTFE